MEEDKITTVEVVGNEMSIMREKAAIDSQIATANAYPRNVEACVNDALFTATIDTDTAMTCTYSLPRGGKAITGPSVHLARIIYQNWGNFRADTKVVNVTSTYVESEAVAWDLQKNVAIKVSVRRSILQNKGKDRMNEDMILVTGNATNSIALRNAVFAVIPKGITDMIYKASQEKIFGNVKEFNKTLTGVLAAFKKKYNKDEADVLKIVGKTDKKQLTNEDLLTLIGVGNSLKDGDTKVEYIWKPTPEEKKTALKAKQADPKSEEAKPTKNQMP